MKKYFLILPLYFVCIYATAQDPTDFFVGLSKNASDDSLQVTISVPLHVNIGYEVIQIEIRQKGEEEHSIFQKSSRFPKKVTSNLNVYTYELPFRFIEGITYEITIENAKICNMGPFTITETFNNLHTYTYSYATPGYKLISSIQPKK